MMNESNRLRYIDIAKGIAIICIILGHLGNSNINRAVFTFHVPIFFLITGYFINQKRSVKEFIGVKFKTLIIPYIVTCCVIIVLGTFKGWLNHDTVNTFKTWVYASLYGAGDGYTEPFYIPSIGALWFLLATFWGSCFLRISLDLNKYLRMLLVGILFVIGYQTRSICWFPLSIQAGMCATLYMYIGYLVNDAKKIVSNLSDEVKCFSVLFALITWFFFMKDFQSFWFVHCDVGRGIVDIFGSLCACLIVICFSKVLDSNTKYISNFLSYFGKYSLLVLSVHITELNVFSWWRVTDKFIQYGLSEFWQLIALIFVKLVFDLTCAFVLSKSTVVKKVYGLK